ncbi:MAG: threonine ammonia-lyase [Acidimicrobiia bacterium]|nr:threonine ammonia-lyase [Acidimicrobiia bacterium]NNC74250.1 threonine ammonia-lyase [Acidimicrobiia bacterium]
MPTPVTLAEIEAARTIAADVALVTPMIPTHSFSAMAGTEVWMKAESLQRTGSFKIRGALNRLSKLKDPGKGVVAASAGNHAQGVALAASHYGIVATVFMPVDASIPKVNATKGYGAHVQLVGDDLGEAVDAATEFAQETGAELIHPYDDPAIIAGQGTLGLEVIEQLPTAGVVVIPTGGGGLLGGSAAAIKALRPDTVVIGVEAEAMPLYGECRRAGKPVDIPSAPTVADGIAIPRASETAFACIEAHVDDLVTVSDVEATETVALLLERAKFLVEPAGAVGLAAVLARKVPIDRGPVVAVLSGGNVDLLLIDRIVRHGLEARGRFGTVTVRVPDSPGNLAGVVNTIADLGGNVLAVEHHREGTGLQFGEVEIFVAIATRSTEHHDEIMGALGEFGVIG